VETVVERWSTEEISLAAYLSMMLGVDPVVEWQTQYSCVFKFEDSVELTMHVVKFVSGECRVEPKEYFLKATALRKEMFRIRPR